MTPGKIPSSQLPGTVRQACDYRKIFPCRVRIVLFHNCLVTSGHSCGEGNVDVWSDALGVLLSGQSRDLLALELHPGLQGESHQGSQRGLWWGGWAQCDPGSKAGLST